MVRKISESERIKRLEALEKANDKTYGRLDLVNESVEIYEDQLKISKEKYANRKKRLEQQKKAYNDLRNKTLYSLKKIQKSGLDKLTEVNTIPTASQYELLSASDKRKLISALKKINREIPSAKKIGEVDDEKVKKDAVEVAMKSTKTYDEAIKGLLTQRQNSVLSTLNSFNQKLDKSSNINKIVKAAEVYKNMRKGTPEDAEMATEAIRAYLVYNDRYRENLLDILRKAQRSLGDKDYLMYCASLLDNIDNWLGYRFEYDSNGAGASEGYLNARNVMIDTLSKMMKLEKDDVVDYVDIDEDESWDLDYMM